MLRGGAVDADPVDPGTAGKVRCDLLHRRAVGEMRPVPAGERHPRWRGRIQALEQPPEHACLARRGDRLHREQIGPGAGQHLQPPPVESGEARVVDGVIAGVLRAVRQERPVGSYARRDERPPPASAVRRIAPEPVALLRGELHREPEDALGFLVGESVAGKAGEAGLIGGGDDAVRARFEEPRVNRADRVGRLDQHPRRPERVIQVEAVGFEFGGEAAVEDQGLGVPATLARPRFTEVSIAPFARPWRAVPARGRCSKPSPRFCAVGAP